MEVNVRFLDNLRLEASFDDFKICTDQPIRYKGDGTAPSPFDYFLASSALCAAYFVKVYCKARDIPTEDIRISQNNIIDPENRYNQIFRIEAELPEHLSEKHRKGILMAMDRCTVKKVIQTSPDFQIEESQSLGKDDSLIYKLPEGEHKTRILGKDLPLEDTIKNMTEMLKELGIKIEIASWRNIVPNVWSVHIRDAESPMCFTNGKGSTKESALCSALGEYMERISCNYFYNDHYLGEELSNEDFVHYPNEKWFAAEPEDLIPEGLMDDTFLKIYNPDGELLAGHLYDTNSGRIDRGVVALPFVRQSDKEKIYIPVSLIGNLFVSNGMSAGNTLAEAKVQCLSEIFERAVKKEVICDELALPDVPEDVLKRYPSIVAGIRELEAKGYPVLVKDASLGGKFPVMCVTLMNPRNGGVFASFGAHPKFEVALERSLTELLQGRSFEGLNDVLPPSFKSEAVKEPNNFVEHFVDSIGVVSWKFFSAKSAYEFVDWNFSGSTEEENDYLMSILKDMGKEVYVADYEDLGAKACRILVPGYSEIYPVEDLVWDNTNRSLYFRDDVLNLQSLDSEALEDLLDKLEESELDNYTRISELIGIEFDENTPWGQLDIGELKGMICLALGRVEDAREHVERFIQFNDNSNERRLFYQSLSALIDIHLDDHLELDDFKKNLDLMFGPEIVDEGIRLITGEDRFHGLHEIGEELNGLDKHQRLIESYRKLKKARANLT